MPVGPWEKAGKLVETATGHPFECVNCPCAPPACSCATTSFAITGSSNVRGTVTKVATPTCANGSPINYGGATCFYEGITTSTFGPFNNKLMVVWGSPGTPLSWHYLLFSNSTGCVDIGTLSGQINSPGNTTCPNGTYSNGVILS
jgi:hypothetical protein